MNPLRAEYHSWPGSSTRASHCAAYHYAMSWRYERRGLTAMAQWHLEAADEALMSGRAGTLTVRT